MMLTELLRSNGPLTKLLLSYDWAVVAYFADVT
jgi:hypothetical protein